MAKPDTPTLICPTCHRAQPAHKMGVYATGGAYGPVESYPPVCLQGPDGRGGSCWRNRPKRVGRKPRPDCGACGADIRDEEKVARDARGHRTGHCKPCWRGVMAQARAKSDRRDEPMSLGELVKRVGQDGQRQSGSRCVECHAPFRSRDPRVIHCSKCGGRTRIGNGELTPIQRDCIDRQANCHGCFHALIVESLKPGQCQVKTTDEVIAALRHKESQA